MSGDGLLGLGYGTLGTSSEGREAAKSENKFRALLLGNVWVLNADSSPGMADS